MTSRSRARLASLFAVAGVLVTIVAVLTPIDSASASTAPYCGATVHKPDGSAWVCTFDDEFTGTTLDLTKWTVQQTAIGGYTTGSPGNHVCYVASKNNVNVSGGYLSLIVRKEANVVRCGALTSQFTGGTVSTYGHFSQTYGRFEVRARFPSATVAGLQEALWLWPVNSSRYGPEPTSGEIDFAEAYSLHPTLMVPYIHYTPQTIDYNVTSSSCSITVGAFHTYTLVWSTTTMTIAVDGKTCLTDTWTPAAPLVSPAPFDQPFFLVLTQGLGMNGNAYNPVKPAPMPAITTVDYARIWK